MTIFEFVLLCILVVMAITLVRALLGPTLYDRILSINTFGTATVLAIAVFGFVSKRPDFMDIALLYALINFVGTIAVLKLHTFNGLSHSGSKKEE